VSWPFYLLYSFSVLLFLIEHVIQFALFHISILKIDWCDGQNDSLWITRYAIICFTLCYIRHLPVLLRSYLKSNVRMNRRSEEQETRTIKQFSWSSLVVAARETSIIRMITKLFGFSLFIVSKSEVVFIQYARWYSLNFCFYPK